MIGLMHSYASNLVKEGITANVISPALVETDMCVRIRREMLGSKYVDSAMETADDFNTPLQELVTTYCWGECWGRPGLDRRTRSIMNLALTKNDIQEVFLQVAIYVGVPAAVDSFDD